MTLDPLPSQVNTGDTVTFSGVFETADGYSITGATIYIKDDVDFGTDTILGTVTTDDKGEFVATWEAQSRSGGGSYDFYTVYEGSSQFAKARSQTFSVFVSGTSSGYSTPSSGSSSSSYYPTTISLDRIPSSVYTDQTVTLTGELTSSGNPVPGALVKIMEDDPLVPDQLLVQGFTDSSGRFSLTWDVTGGYVETDFDVYATFDADGTYAYARSNNQVMSVLRYGGSISLDPFPSSAQVGDMVTFSGTLKLNKGNTEGAVVYIKDEDPFSADDLLATGYVDSSGRFSANWFASYVDPDNTVDIYAVFEGNDILFRQTTCDSGPTMPIGGSCQNTVPLKLYGTIPTPPTQPPDEEITGNEYMKLYYSLDFSTNPLVAIVPSPDSYNEVRSDIIPVEEGILMWKSQLEQKYGGNWDVDFEVIAPGTLFFQSKPDIIVNIVNYDKEIDCASEFIGLAYVTGVKPIQTWTCSSYRGVKLSNSDVAATSAHEFIHAVGLGHTFGLSGDLMCSSENGQATCPNSYSKSNTPSALNLAATVKLYGTDGFKNPNNSVTYGTKFYAGDSISGVSTSSIPVTPTPTPPSTQSPTPTSTPTQNDSDYDGISDDLDSCWANAETYNGYLDTDGCPDSIRIIDDWKSKALEIQLQVNSKIEGIKPGVYTAENSLYGAYFKNPTAQKELENAWTAVWWAKKYLADAEWTQKEGNELISQSDFKDAYYKLDYSFNSAKEINQYLFEINDHVNKAHSLESQYLAERENNKFCFLFWCW
ncbi:MAG: hypothetical protein ACREAL_00890 [Nitrosopumilaceae archaeon]